MPHTLKILAFALNLSSYYENCESICVLHMAD